MPKDHKNIGSFIADIRQERGLTQLQLAKSVGTSQSAINRIEKGGQNLSLEMISKISEALSRPIISVANPGVNLKVTGGKKLSGSITLKTSKNAAVALLCASLLNKGKTTFKAFPRIEEVFRIIEVLESIGVKVSWLEGNDLEIRPPQKLKLENIDYQASKKTRSVLMMIGALMHDYSNFKIPYSGGCKLGTRTVKPHLFALEEFGVQISAKQDFYQVSVRAKSPKEITLYESGDTVTENAIMAAARTKGSTRVNFASGNYMVQELCGYLNALGVKIDGIGTTTPVIHGSAKEFNKNVIYAPSEDPIEAMFFISAAVATDSKITIKRVPIEFISLEILKLKKMGLKIDSSDSYLAHNGFTKLVDLTIHKHGGKLKALQEPIHANVYPMGINQDNLPYFVPIVAVAKGKTLIHDWAYENRAIYYTELTRLGANVELLDPHRINVTGPTTFSSADLVCPPALRPASLLLVGMMAAKGTSMLRNVYTINRGYEDLANRLNQLGANIEVIRDNGF